MTNNSIKRETPEVIAPINAMHLLNEAILLIKEASSPQNARCFQSEIWSLATLSSHITAAFTGDLFCKQVLDGELVALEREMAIVRDRIS